MKYTQEELKQKLLQALENSEYYSTLWSEEGGKEAREDKGYYQGQANVYLDLYGDLITSAEKKAAIMAGRDKYYDEQEDDTDDDEEEY